MSLCVSVNGFLSESSTLEFVLESLQVQFVVLLPAGTPAFGVRSNATHTARVAKVAECRILDALVDLIASGSHSGSISGTHSTGTHAHALGGPEAIAFVVGGRSSENHISIRDGSCGPGVFPISVGHGGGLGVSKNDIQVRVLGSCKNEHHLIKDHYNRRQVHINLAWVQLLALIFSTT